MLFPRTLVLSLYPYTGLISLHRQMQEKVVSSVLTTDYDKHIGTLLDFSLKPAIFTHLMGV
jgi:hypothetical protein